MKVIPTSLPLTLVSRTDAEALGYSEQHHRNEEHKVGVLTIIQGEGRPIRQRWYCDYAVNVVTDELDELVKLMSTTGDLADEAAVEDYPMVISVRSIELDTPPACEINSGQTATKTAILAYSWHHANRKEHYIGSTAYAAYQGAGDPQAYLLVALGA